MRNVGWILNKKVIYSALSLLAFTLMYGLVYQPWRSWHTTLVQYSLYLKFVKTALFMFDFSIDMSFLMVCLGIMTIIYRREKPDVFLLLVFLFSLAVYPCLIYYTSLYERLMLTTIPFLSIIIAVFLVELYRVLQKTSFNKLMRGAVFYSILIAALTVPDVLSFPGNIISRHVHAVQRDIPSKIKLAYFLKFINGVESDDFLHRSITDPQWVQEAIGFLESKDVGTDEWVFSTFSNAVFLFYSDYKVQLIWPVKKSFLDSYRERFWIFIGPYDSEDSACHWFYKFSRSGDGCKNRNYYDIIKTAKKYMLPSGAVVYECNPFL